jgi:CubicO group peptidase (beta-lactamase class C family)
MARLLAGVAVALASAACSLTTDSPYPAADAEQVDGGALSRAAHAAREVEGMRSLLVGRHGRLIMEEYFNGQDPSEPFEVRSVTKSVTSALVGIAIREGFISGVDATLADYLGPVVGSLDTAKGRITLDDLLTMRAGHYWQELVGVSEFNDWVSAPDQIAYILAKPLVNPPGTAFNYSDGSAHLAGVLLAEATGMSALDFARRYLFAPLGIGPASWLADNRGYDFGGVGLALTSRDLLTFGTLYLNGGKWDGRQVVPAEWVARSTAPHAATGEAVPYGREYGYYWWIGEAAGQRFYFAMGHGGQFIVVVPSTQLVIVATCEWRGVGARAGAHWQAIADLIVHDILPAAH